MSKAFNLASYDDVKAHAAAIYDRVRGVGGAVMPPPPPRGEGQWPRSRIELFAKWMADFRLPALELLECRECELARRKKTRGASRGSAALTVRIKLPPEMLREGPANRRGAHPPEARPTEWNLQRGVGNPGRQACVSRRLCTSEKGEANMSDRDCGAPADNCELFGSVRQGAVRCDSCRYAS